MASTLKGLQSVNLPLILLPVPPTTYPSIVSATVDNLPAYFDGQCLETTTVPEGWEIHFDVTMEMRERGYWEDVSSMLGAAVNLNKSATKFASEWNRTFEECFEVMNVVGKVVELKLKDDIVGEWNEKLGKLRREVERALRVFVREVFDGDVERRVKKCFDQHRNLGLDGYGKKWWNDNVMVLLDHGEQWMAAAFTLETWLEDLALLIQKRDGEVEGVKGVKVYADVLCPSFEQGKGLRSRTELVYLLRDGKVSKKGKMAWISIELGHVVSC